MKMYRYKILNFFFKVSNHNPLSQLPKSDFLFSVIRVNVIRSRFCSSEVVSPESSEKNTSILHPVEKLDLSDYGSAMSRNFNFAMYADKSPLIQKYIDLGVNLHEIEKRPEEAQFLVTLSLKKIQPYLSFLSDIGVSDDEIGKVITKNPFIFKEDLDDLQVRVNYLSSKKFDKEMITTIITKNSRWLSTPVRAIDERLGYLQKTFKLKGDDVRKMIVKSPVIALISKKRIITNIFVLKEELGLDEYSLKEVVVSEPHLLKLNPYDLVATYEYLVNTMKVPVVLVLKQPSVLTCRKFILNERHKFLESLGKAQYCHLLPGYVNLTNLVRTTDTEFCNNIAKTSVNLFYDFLKTL